MKKLITIITVILIALNLSAQVNYNPYSVHRTAFNKNLTVYGLMLGSILLDASGDAMMDSGNKELGHLLNAGSIACLLTIPIVKKIELKKAPWYLAGYVGLRFTMFDPVYGAVHPDVNYLHQGTRSYYDQFMNQWSAESLLFLRGLTFVASFDITMKRI